MSTLLEQSYLSPEVVDEFIGPTGPCAKSRKEKGQGSNWEVSLSQGCVSSCTLRSTNSGIAMYTRVKGKFPCQTFTRRRVVKLVERPVPNVETQGSGVRFLQGVT